MQPVDPHKLFSIFEQGDEQVYQEHQLNDVLDNPFVLMGMVMRGIENYQLMDMMYMRQYPTEYKRVRRITKHKYYDKLYSYLTRISLTSQEQIYTIGESFSINEVDGALNHLRIYYETFEKYERCAIIKKYIDLLNAEKTLI